MTTCGDLHIGDVLLAPDGGDVWVLVMQDGLDSTFLELNSGQLSVNANQGEIDTEHFDLVST